MEDNYGKKVLSLIESKISDETNDLIVSKRLSSLIEYELKTISFIASLKSYKSNSLLRPFPNDFLHADNRKDFDKLVGTFVI